MFCVLADMLSRRKRFYEMPETAAWLSQPPSESSASHHQKVTVGRGMSESPWRNVEWPSSKPCTSHLSNFHLLTTLTITEHHMVIQTCHQRMLNGDRNFSSLFPIYTNLMCLPAGTVMYGVPLWPPLSWSLRFNCHGQCGRYMTCALEQAISYR